MPNPAIDQLRDPQGGFDHEAVKSILPYGPDFLFVDRVAHLSADRVEASYTIPGDSTYLRSHFLGLPIMPGVLVGEAMAQSGTLLVRYNLEDHHDKDILAFQIESARFPAPAQPGDKLDFRVHLLKLRSRVARLEGEATVGHRRVCQARIVLGIIDRRDLRSQLEALGGS